MIKNNRRRINSRQYKNTSNQIKLKHIIITQSLFCVIISTIFLANSFFKVSQINSVYDTMKSLISKELNLDDFKYIKEKITESLSVINKKLNLNGVGGGLLDLNLQGINYYKAPKNHTFNKAYLTNNFINPLKEYKVTSKYGFRTHPILNKNDFHTGIDLACEKDSEIVSVDNGIVLESSFNKDYGNYIVLQHGENIKTFYGHCETLLVKKDDIVKKGDIIAKAGSTGMSTGTHLHFEISVQDYKIDPKQVINF